MESDEQVSVDKVIDMNVDDVEADEFAQEVAEHLKEGIRNDDAQLIPEMLNELMTKILKQSTRVAEIDSKLTEAIELFKHGQKEMHRLISESQTRRFSSSGTKSRKGSVKAYDKEDAKIFKSMATAFSEKTGQKSDRIFAQNLNLECLRVLSHQPGQYCNNKTTTGALERLNGDIQSGKPGVPSFKRYFELGINYLESFQVEISDEIKNHVANMVGNSEESSESTDSSVDNESEVLDIPEQDTRGSIKESDDYGAGEL